MRNTCLVIFLIGMTCWPVQSLHAQSPVSETELQEFLNGQKLLITYREGEVVYGTYYFIEVHYCPNGYYGLYASTIKRTVMGQEQKGGWQEYGQWKVMTQEGQTGLHYTTTMGVQRFVPFYKLANGDMFVADGITLVKQGVAICP